MFANNIELVLDTLISGARPKDRYGLFTTLLESIKNFFRTEDELTPEQAIRLLMGDLVTLMIEKTIEEDPTQRDDVVTLMIEKAIEENPTQRDEIVKFIKVLGHTKYLPEAVKNLGEREG